MNLTSNYIYDDASWDTIIKDSSADTANAGRFNEANPFYTYNCLNNSGETKARIRLFIREWNKPFKGNDSIDLIDPDSNLANDNMDDTSDLDDSYIGEKWNRFEDFDDASTYTPSGNPQCDSNELPKYSF